MNKKILLIVIIVLVILFGALYYSNKNKVVGVKEVQFNEEITLAKNETIKVKDQDIYLTIKDFINSPAPEGTQAIWSGLAVIYELKINNETFSNSYNTPYNVNIIDTDYKTYAKISITKK